MELKPQLIKTWQVGCGTGSGRKPVKILTLLELLKQLTEDTGRGKGKLV